ncbi:MAG: Hsp20/alpha crystallin family protein [Acidimicrobiales bacterium]
MQPQSEAMAKESAGMAKESAAMAKQERQAVDRWEPFGRLMDWPGWFRGGDLMKRVFDDESTMRIEEFTEGDEVVVRCELPGVDPDKDVDITVAGGVLTIRAERRQEEKTEEKGRYRSEFRYGSLSRSIALPAGVEADQIKATYGDGVLEVRVKVDSEKASGAKVPVTRA